MSRRSALSVFARVLCAFTVISFHARADEPFVVVSDVDDTVKITNVGDLSESFHNTLHSKLVFAGMPELYKQMLGVDSAAERLRFLSAGILTKHTSKLLRNAGFPAHELTLREFSTFRDLRRAIGSIQRFKTSQLQQLYGKSQRYLILIGDDTQSDPDAYTKFALKHKGRVLAIYIRRITGDRLPDACKADRAIPAGCIPIVTAYDIAVHEFLAGRLSEAGVAAVGDAVLNSDASILLPDFQTCTGQLTDITTQPESLATRQVKINARLTELCNKRGISATPSRKRSS